MAVTRSGTAYRSGGTGDHLLLLLHGLGATGAVWDRLLPLVERSWPGPWAVPDLRGHGRSVAEPPYGYAVHAADAASLVGAARADELQELTLALYRRGAEIAASAGIVLADTKFEFGLSPSGGLVLGDEVLTPDSSRFWPATLWSPGGVQPSYDKQYVRDWLTSSGWDRVSPPPELPADVVEATRERYVTAYERLTGTAFR